MSWWSNLKSLLSGSKRYTASVEGEDFIEHAFVEIREGSQAMEIKFQEPIKEGNDIDGVMVLTDGTAILSDDLYPSETKYELSFKDYTPEEKDYTFSFVDSDGSVVAKDIVKLRRE